MADPKPVEISTWDKEFTADMDQGSCFFSCLVACEGLKALEQRPSFS